MTSGPGQFVVAGIVDGQELLRAKYCSVIGRCGQTPVRLGDRFDGVVRFDEPKSTQDYERPPKALAEEKVELAIQKISAYGRERTVLEAGMTGSLVLTGLGLDKLGAGCALMLSVPSAAKNGEAASQVDATPVPR